jgi:hypothetical protein
MFKRQAHMLSPVDRFHHNQPNQEGSVEDPAKAFIGRRRRDTRLPTIDCIGNVGCTSKTEHVGE